MVRLPHPPWQTWAAFLQDRQDNKYLVQPFRKRALIIRPHYIVRSAGVYGVNEWTTNRFRESLLYGQLRQATLLKSIRVERADRKATTAMLV